MRHPEKVERRLDRVPDVRYQGGMATEKNSGCKTSGWNVGREEFRGVRHPDGMEAKKDSGCETSEWNGGREGFRM